MKAILVLLAFFALSHAKIFLGYYPSWAPSQASQPGCGLQIKDIPVKNYTHLAFAFLNVAASGQVSVEGADVLRGLVGLKTNSPSLKILASVGGGGPGVDLWNSVMGTAQARSRFINSTLTIVQNYKLDGIDLDIEGIDENSGPKIVTFVQEFRNAAGPSLIITAASPAGPYWLNMYHPENIAKLLDFFNVMLYDYAGFDWSDTTGPLTPLYGRDLGINTTLAWYESHGISKDKIVFGFANYAATFTVANPGLGVDNKNHKGGLPGSCDHSSGTLTHREVELLIANPPSSDFQVRWDPVSYTPYITYRDQFITYDDERSIGYKLEYLNQKQYAGGMVWTVDYSHVITDLISKSLVG